MYRGSCFSSSLVYIIPDFPVYANFCRIFSAKQKPRISSWQNEFFSPNLSACKMPAEVISPAGPALQLEPVRRSLYFLHHLQDICTHLCFIFCLIKDFLQPLFWQQAKSDKFNQFLFSIFSQISSGDTL